MADFLKKQDLELLSKTPLFSGYSSDELAGLLANRGRILAYRDDEVIYDCSKYYKAAGCLLTGRLKICTENGILLNILQPGSLFGVAGLFSQEETFVTTIKSVKDVRIYFLTDSELEALFKADFKICHNYLVFLSKRIVFLNQRISSFVADTPADALYAFLARQAAEREENFFHLKISKQEICRQLNISRTTLYRAWNILVKEGSIKENSDTSLSVFPRLVADH